MFIAFTTKKTLWSQLGTINARNCYVLWIGLTWISVRHRGAVG